MTPTASATRRAGILAVTAQRQLFTFRHRVPVDVPKLLSRVQCAECGAKISEGRAGRRCKACREKSIVWRN